MQIYRQSNQFQPINLVSYIQKLMQNGFKLIYIFGGEEVTETINLWLGNLIENKSIICTAVTRLGKLKQSLAQHLCMTKFKNNLIWKVNLWKLF